jgi:hypothetical protein
VRRRPSRQRPAGTIPLRTPARGVWSSGVACLAQARADRAAIMAVPRCARSRSRHRGSFPRARHIKIQGKSLLVRWLNTVAAVISTPLSAPVIAARLRGGNAASARCAASFAAEAGRHGAGSRVHRADRGADGLGALRREGDRRDRPGGRAVLRHGPAGLQGPGPDRDHPRPCTVRQTKPCPTCPPDPAIAAVRFPQQHLRREEVASRSAGC